MHDESFLLKQLLYHLEQFVLQPVFLEKVSEVEDRCFVGDAAADEVNVEELLEGATIVDGVLHAGI